LLTTVTQPIEELAERAVSRLLEKIGATAAESKRQTAQTITLMPRLVIRDSCARLTPPERSNMPAPR
jgi:DNA-binding LacI/PurR family transcriptional regulator